MLSRKKTSVSQTSLNQFQLEILFQYFGLKKNYRFKCNFKSNDANDIWQQNRNLIYKLFLFSRYFYLKKIVNQAFTGKSFVCKCNKLRWTNEFCYNIKNKNAITILFDRIT